MLGIFAIFLICASTGAGSWLAAALGVAIGAAGLALYVVSALNSREFTYVPGTANVQSCSPPPASTQYGRCELLLIVHAPGMDDVAVKTREPRVPVAKWPHEGSTLPILVAISDRRRIKVLWDQVRSHGDAARAQDQGGYPDDDAQPTANLGDMFADGDDADDIALDGIDPTAGYVELDVMPDPAVFGPGPIIGKQALPDDDFGDQESAGIDEASGAMESIEVELSPVVQEAGAGGPGASTDEGRRPSPVRRPSPRPRRPVHDEIDDALDSGTVMTAGPLVNPAAPPQPAVGPTEPVELAEVLPDAASLQVDHVVPVDPAVLAIPEQTTADDAEIADAYLAATPPPGQSPGRSVRGVGVTLFVTNLTRSVAFYRDTLGFAQVDEGLGSAVLESGDSRIVLRRVADMAPVDRRLVHLLLEVPDVQTAYDDLRGRGVTFVHRPRAVSRYEQLELWSAAFRDPDGHGIALVRWDLRQPRTERRTEST
jgi:catechol 2,3-dioxygenase-like lactoylglutathione lyase family enzyme